MRLRPHRRNLVVWSQSAGPADRYGGLPVIRSTRAEGSRGWIRRGALLSVAGLMRLVRGLAPYWRPLTIGTLFTVVGVVLRDGPGGVILLPGLMFLMSAPLFPARSRSDRSRRLELERELAEYSTRAQQRDLEATLDQYPDDVTRELRDILTSQDMAAYDNRFPAIGRY
jgi:hypothetical protein